MDAATLLPATGITLEDARRRLAGLHFTKEALSNGEREILYIAEGLLRLIDNHTNSDLDQVRTLALSPGISGVDVHEDGVEVVGTPLDADASVGFVKGCFSVQELRAVLGTIPVTDCR